MSGQKSSRGRPKGSGLDDQGRLRAIAKLIAADPSLKTTTAIKKIGITDPSVIRRLRDKFRDFDQPGETVRVAASAADSRKIIPLPLRNTSLRQEPPARHKDPAVAVAGIESRTGRFATGATDWLAVWSGLGLRAIAATVEIQIAVVGQALRMPPITAAMRQQLYFNELALSLCFSEPEAPKSVH